MKLGNLIADSQAEQAERYLEAALADSAMDRDPLLLKILTGAAAWLASLFLFGFLALATGFDEEGFLALGIILSGLAILSHHKAKKGGVFIEQTTLSCMMCGHLLLLIGVLAVLGGRDELFNLTVTQTVLCALPIWAFKRAAYQASVLLLAAGLWTAYAVETGSPWLFRLVLATQVFAFAALALWRAKRSPFAYALALSSGAMIFFLDWAHSLGYMGRFEEPLWPTNLILAVLVAAVGWHCVRPANRMKPVILCAYGLLLALAFLSSPDLLYVIALLILGYGLRDRILTGLGLLSLPLFLVYFYYSLEVSLLQKSGILFASGVVCLLGALLAQRSCREVNP